jgi:hypothetical protein
LLDKQDGALIDKGIADLANDQGAPTGGMKDINAPSVLW